MNTLFSTEIPQSERRISDRLDYYKLTMGQVAFENHPDAEVTFTLKNRAGDYPLGEYVNEVELEAHFQAIVDQGFTPEEIAYYAGLEASDGSARFDEAYLDFLADLKLTDVRVTKDPQTQELTIDSTGPWANVSLWETIVMSEVNELYNRNALKAQGKSLEEVWQEGDRRLDEKIAKLKDHPDIKFADFGTRRRFSTDWHSHVLGRLANELPDNLVGTSNPWLAYKFNLKPIGTYAHEMPMVYAALAGAEDENPLDGEQNMLEDWQNRYKGDLSIALSDTFTSEHFLATFTEEQAKTWAGLRHDSGDPISFGERVLAFYEAQDIDPATKTIVFSDGLDVDTIIELTNHFKGRINILFGWGTTLMNDLGVRANNIVMKATRVNGYDTVKLSDDEGKHTGPTEEVDRYKRLVEARLAAEAVYARNALAEAV